METNLKIHIEWNKDKWIELDLFSKIISKINLKIKSLQKKITYEQQNAKILAIKPGSVEFWLSVISNSLNIISVLGCATCYVVRKYKEKHNDKTKTIKMEDEKNKVIIEFDDIKITIYKD